MPGARKYEKEHSFVAFLLGVGLATIIVATKMLG